LDAKETTKSFFSSLEAEYQALSECMQEAVFTQNLLMELRQERENQQLYMKITWEQFSL
jgi:hypothetical protein